MASFRKEFSLDKLDLCGKLIGILEEPGGDANFVVNYFIWESLREEESSCCLLSLKYAFNHYFHVGLKFGYNLTTQKSRAIVLEALKACFLSNLENNFFNTTTEVGLQNLFLILKKECELLLEKYKKVFLIIDDISYLLSAGFPIKALLLFCHYLRTLQTKGITVVLLTHFSQSDQETMNIKSFLDQNADMKFQVSPLRTGTAQDISGSVTLTQKSCTIEHFTKSVVYHYKLTERNIKLFPPGSI